MINKISIDLFRVSSDSQYLDAIFSVPNEFIISSFILIINHFEGNELIGNSYQLVDALEEGLKEYVIRIPLYELGVNYPAIYTIELKALHDEYGEIVDDAMCSDVNSVYRCLLRSVIENCDMCDTPNVSDEVIRNYLILYGHHAAMSQKDIDIATEYFKILSRCFDPCGLNASDCRENVKPSNCGCHA